MIITPINFLALLNMDLELETTSAIQYINHAALMRRLGVENLSAIFKVYAYQKVEHAMMLAEGISLFGGCPSVNISRVHTSGDGEAMVWYDIEDEEDAIRRNQIRIEQARQFNDAGLLLRLQMMLRVQREHLTYLKNRVTQGSDHIPECSAVERETEDLSTHWAEKAAKVPPRFKKNSGLSAERSGDSDLTQ